MELKNFMEELVFERLDEVLQTQENMCKCQQCRLDVAAKALNILPPRYVVTDKGEMYTKVSLLSSQFDIDLLTALIAAAKTVAIQPHHSK